MINYDYIQKNLEEFSSGNVSVVGASEYGLIFNIIIPESIDFLDFIEELGKYFYRIDDPKFGQKFINEQTKLYIYDWLVQILNTGNYDIDESTGDIIADLEFLIDFDKINTFKYALRKYKEKYRNDKNKIEHSRLLAEQAAINILEIIERIRLISLSK